MLFQDIKRCHSSFSEYIIVLILILLQMSEYNSMER